MSNKPGLGSDIKCPFFAGFIERRILCESPVDGADQLSLHFSTLSKRYSHILWYCNQIDGAGCPVHEMLKKKYEEQS